MAATRQGHGKRQLLEENDTDLLDSVGAVKLFARLTELISATLARAAAIFFARAKKAQISLNIVTLQL